VPPTGSTKARSASKAQPTTGQRGAGAKPTGSDHGAGSGALVAVKRLFAADHANYYLLLGTTLFLVAFGLVMVLSSSSVESYKDDSDSFASFLRQGLYALIGLPLMLVASRMPPQVWKRWAWPALCASVFLQLLVFVPGIGWGWGSNTNWIKIGPITAQPSEIVKLGLILWIAFVLTRKVDLLDDWKHVAIPIVPVAGLAIALVLAGNDLGTATIMLFIVFGCLFFAGIRLKFLATAGVVVGTIGIAFALAGSSRLDRINSWLTGCTSVDANECWQPVHGTWALASGGIFGVGLGNSKMKWSWLPEADNDFIFAIIGEELGLIGAIVVILLFVVLAIAFLRIIRSTKDRFGRIVASGVMVWIVAQALVNIAVVLGLLPVLGVPLPLISAGGSALISTMLAIGVVLSFARQPTETDDGVLDDVSRPETSVRRSASRTSLR
jgi:cell division protein FtsW